MRQFHVLPDPARMMAYRLTFRDLMTALLAFEAIETGRATPDTPVVMSAHALAAPPSKMGFPVGTAVRLEDALILMVVKSANDLAIAIGETIAGSETDFVARMNAKAAELGMTATHFTNPNGLHDPAQHAFSKISGDVRLSIDVRSHDPRTLEEMRERLLAIVGDVEAAQRVRIELGALTGSDPAVMDAGLLETFGEAMVRAGTPRFAMACGAGHDAAVFAGQGVPTLMLFVRNQNGSHNPDEAMQIADFAVVTRVLAQGLAMMS